MPQTTRVSFVAGKTTTHAFFNPEGTEVEFTIGGAATIVSDPESVLNLAAKLAKLARESLQQRSKAKGEHGFVQVTRVARAAASTPVGSDVVAVAFQEANGIVEHFGLTPEESQALRPQMEKAELDARQNRTQTIQ